MDNTLLKKFLINLYNQYINKHKNIYLFSNNNIINGSLYYFMKKAHILFVDLETLPNNFPDNIEIMVTLLYNCKNHHDYHIVDISQGSYEKLIENINTKLNVTFENDFLENIDNIATYYCKNNTLIYILNCKNMKYFLLTNQYTYESNHIIKKFYNFCMFLKEKKDIYSICPVHLNNKTHKIKL